MTALSRTSHILADELRKAERSINLAARDTAQFLLTTLDATDIHGVSPTVLHRTVKATVDALTALAESQHQIAIRAHLSIEKAGTSLGLDVTDWGVGYPKPPIQPLVEHPSFVTA